MIEKNILIENINPLIFFGVNNLNINKITKLYPNIKIVARGNEIKIFGSQNETELLSEKINELIRYCSKYNQLPDEVVDYTLQTESIINNEQNNSNEIVITFSSNGKPIKAFTPNQKLLVEQSNKNDLIFIVGPAGSGKTYTAIALAVRALKNREVKRIILSRPAVEAGENLGYLPGDLKEKLDPYLQPLYDALRDMIPVKKLKEYLDENIVEIAPLAFMRGRTLDNAFVILDEAQNATSPQIKMFLTRMGRSAKFIVTGDLTQVDLPRKNDSGLTNAIEILQNIEGISTIVFDERDILRHKLVKSIVKAYEKNN
ncbi:MAG: phosphate starvation-inducible protein PhoH [Bacteroidetes bacterium CG02_land_8_20_14_3_00_31_25]|nr:PhoH family protein [Bacteroidota bacterium]PIV58292.1 MAG: phosphate starvation-inducible protein PhoH [Bacteroidetes bacterium CG02_land_8_20_14_3_00_31_25]PIX36381.1 MAG: phosphate starvation-inducible protein PhoH [Bacteroidetes bacterium CG_4_8_14_3_um_filter_31_14]